MKALNDPEFLDYMEKFSQNIKEFWWSADEIRWGFGLCAFHSTIELAALGFQVSYRIEPTPTRNTSILINGNYNGKVLAVRFYNEIEIIDIASSERLPGATKLHEDNRTYFVKVFRAKDCLNASLYLEKLISKIIEHNVNLCYR